MRRHLGAAIAAALATPIAAFAAALPAYGTVRKSTRFVDGQPVDLLPYMRKRPSGRTAVRDQRMASKRRNQLRAKGQYRKAVR